MRFCQFELLVDVKVGERNGMHHKLILDIDLFHTKRQYNHRN